MTPLNTSQCSSFCLLVVLSSLLSVFSTGRNYSHNGRISLDKPLSAIRQKGVTRATKLCATLKDGLSPPRRS